MPLYYNVKCHLCIRTYRWLVMGSWFCLVWCGGNHELLLLTQDVRKEFAHSRTVLGEINLQEERDETTSASYREDRLLLRPLTSEESQAQGFCLPWIGWENSGKDERLLAPSSMGKHRERDLECWYIFGMSSRHHSASGQQGLAWAVFDNDNGARWNATTTSSSLYSSRSQAVPWSSVSILTKGPTIKWSILSWGSCME